VTNAQAPSATHSAISIIGRRNDASLTLVSLVRADCHPKPTKRISMKTLRRILIGILHVLAALPACAAIELAEGVDYLPSATPEEACTWEAGIASSAVAKSRNAVTLAGKATVTPGLRLSLQVAELKLSRGAKKSKYSATVRANVAYEGKLLATRDFQDDESFSNDQSACDALRVVGASLGESVAGWAFQTRFMQCRDDCSGIHPDEPIAVGAQILIGDADAINDTVRDECRWPTAMVTKLVAAFNEDDPPPRAKLESRAIDIEKYLGRRLLLRVNNVHAAGGGGLSGPKWMDMSGELWDGKSLVASFESHSTSGRGLTMCRSVDSLSDSSADMIAKWLRSPTLDAKLR
jgi:hypothetical protein